MSSVITKAKVYLRGVADTCVSGSKLRRRGFTNKVPRVPRVPRAPEVLRNEVPRVRELRTPGTSGTPGTLVDRLFAWHHEMGGRRARVHDPHVAVGAAAVVRQPQR